MQIQITGQVSAIEAKENGVNKQGAPFSVSGLFLNEGYDTYQVSFFNERADMPAQVAVGQTITVTCALKGRTYFNANKQRNAVALSLTGLNIAPAQGQPMVQPQQQPQMQPQQPQMQAMGQPMGQPAQQYTSPNTMPPNAPIYQGQAPKGGGGLW